MFEVTAKHPKPRWYQLRMKLSFWLVSIAKKVYPENPKVKAFFMKCMMDSMVYGGSITRIDPKDFYTDVNDKASSYVNDFYNNIDDYKENQDGK